MKRFIFIIFLLLPFPIASFGQVAKDVIKSLKKVEAITQSDVYGRDFAKAYADAKAEVDMFLESPEAKKKPELTNSIKKVSLAYHWAGNVWRLKMRGEPYIYSRDAIGQAIFNDFPDAKESLVGTIRLNDAIKWFYSTASDELSRSMKLLYK